jgi:hypothetical protein
MDETTPPATPPTIGVRAFARKHGMALSQVYLHLALGRIRGAYREGRSWRIPAEAPDSRRWAFARLEGDDAAR